MPQWYRSAETEREEAERAEMEAEEEEGDKNAVAVEEEEEEEEVYEESLRRRRAQAELERHYRRLEQPTVPQMHGRPYSATTFLPPPCIPAGVPVAHKPSVKSTAEKPPLLSTPLSPTPQAAIPGVNQWRRAYFQGFFSHVTMPTFQRAPD
ncbi:unnamed protein product [Dibothriocephalus latus]|uniref:Uncharacterized protein n=1 Tax=Dibothriocephalus latus TaxID=60516 RepID=A0A3P7LQR7_DIBLA|nr:unnamed protein product [Dibothriocephalus latus]